MPGGNSLGPRGHLTEEEKANRPKVSRALLLPDQDRVYICLKDAVIEWTDGHTRISEYIFDTLLSQTFHYSIRTIHMLLLSGILSREYLFYSIYFELIIHMIHELTLTAGRPV